MCSELEMKNRLHQECYARSCQENEELRRRCFSAENGATRQKWNEYSLQQDQESRTVSLYWIKFRNYKTDRNLLKIRKSSKILTHRAVLAAPTFHIKLLFPRAANPECSEIWVFPEALLIVNLPDEYLKNHTRIQEIWQHHQGFREEKELRKVGVKSHCIQCLYLAFRERLRKKVWTIEIVLSLWLTMPRISGLALKVG